MYWDKLKTFHHVAEVGNFTRATEILNLTQSAISRSVIDLENHLGYKLFSRHSRGLKLTEEGTILHQSTKRMVHEINSAQEIVHDRQQEPQGWIKLATTAGLASNTVCHLAKFCERYPKIRISIVIEEDVNRAYQKAEVGLYPSTINSTTLVQKYISTTHFKLYASLAYLKKYGTPKTPSDLDDHRLISYGQHFHPYSQMNWFLSIGSKTGKLREPYMELNSGLNLFLAAQAGLGIVTLSPANRNLANSGLIEILPDTPGPSINVYYMYPEHLKQSKRIAVFGDYLKEIHNTN